MRFKEGLRYFVAFFLIFEFAFAGAWTRKAGNVLVVPYYYFYSAEKYYDLNWKKRAIDNGGYFEGQGFGIYFEYGFTDNLNFIGNVPFILNKWMDDYTYKDNYGFGDVEVGLKFKFYDSKVVFTLQTSIIVPVYSVDREPLLGYRQYAGEIRLLFSGGMRPFGLNSYFNIETGFRKFYSKVASQVRFQFLYGIYFNSLTQGLIQFDGVNSIGKGTFATRFNPSIETDYIEGKLSLSLAYRFTYKAWLQAGFFYDVYGKKIGVGRGFFIASWIEI
ncbi:hypothetical protein [Candidatus Kryptobacter tengchongensis]|uniref:MetA-pathway of phenol degradation n=1 Tax=Kryptobacter tengchongensis TaxID=1643429 RepID=A0A656D636_KRYT1|nr:hypothetical protein [Candidatus Kryptobacter tengchongensis]CUS99273.1 hypothetical protein JGI24_00582 [Candidatus Kryptobacter tengchongensis]